MEISIEPDTLIWFEGLDEWRKAKEIDELKEIFELSPPPINSMKKHSEIPQSDQRNKDASGINYKTFSFADSLNLSFLFSFEGRIRRRDYIISLLIFFSFLYLINDLVLNWGYSLLSLLYIPLYWFLFSQGSKRCHDVGVSGWWQIVPFYIVTLVFFKGDSFLNKYGPSPKI
jgi:hypothetical protein